MPPNFVFANDDATGFCVRMFDNDCGTAWNMVSISCLGSHVVTEHDTGASGKQRSRDKGLTIDKDLLEQTCDALGTRVSQDAILNPAGLEVQSHKSVSLACIASERRVASLSVQLRRLCKDLGEGKRGGSVVPIWRDGLVSWSRGPGGGVRGGTVDSPEVLDCVD